jgi:hypothetical protein
LFFRLPPKFLEGRFFFLRGHRGNFLEVPEFRGDVKNSVKWIFGSYKIFEEVLAPREEVGADELEVDGGGSKSKENFDAIVPSLFFLLSSGFIRGYGREEGEREKRGREGERERGKKRERERERREEWDELEVDGVGRREEGGGGREEGEGKAKGKFTSSHALWRPTTGRPRPLPEST